MFHSYKDTRGKLDYLETDEKAKPIPININWLINTLRETNERAERYEKIIHNIANIDSLFVEPDGSEREHDDKEALNEIENMVTPVWNEYCEKSWVKLEQRLKAQTLDKITDKNKREVKEGDTIEFSRLPGISYTIVKKDELLGAYENGAFIPIRDVLKTFEITNR